MSVSCTNERRLKLRGTSETVRQSGQLCSCCRATPFPTKGQSQLPRFLGSSNELQPYAQNRHTPLLALHTTWTAPRAWLGDEQLLPESIKVLLFMLVSRPLQRQHRWLQDTIQIPPDMVVTTDAMQPQIGEWLKKHSYSRKASFFHSRFPEPPMSTHIDVYER
jgi:hypothetical protein